ncbi:MAG: type II secretion system GspH family protein [bacterium]|nr:type II secretion system GspH family protein [bacterium]
MNKQSGFSLIELIVSIAIIVMITTVIMFQYRDYSDVTTLRGQSHEIALALREAQVNATNGKEFAPNTDHFRIQYGVNFVKPLTPAISTFYSYGDRPKPGNVPPNGILETTSDPATNELLSKYSLRPGYTFDICVKANESDPDTSCIGLPSSPTTDLKVLYNFGSFKADIRIGNDMTLRPYAQIKIYPNNKPAVFEMVKIWSSGRIEN